MYPVYIANPSKRRRKKAKASSSPKRRRRSAKRRASVSYARNPAPRRKRRRSFRRNPSPRRIFRRATSGKGKLPIMSLIGPAFGVGLGAVATDVMMGYAPLPEAVKAGPVKHLTKAVLALGAGWLIAKYGNKKLGEGVAAGGIAISVHDFAREQALKFMPALKLGEYMDGIGYYNPAIGVGEYLQGGEPSWSNMAGDAPDMLSYDDALDVSAGMGVYNEHDTTAFDEVNAFDM